MTSGSQFVDLPFEEQAVPAEQAGIRLDAFLADFQSVGVRARAQRAIVSGKVSVNGEPIGRRDAGVHLQAQAVVRVDWNRPGTSAPVARVRDKLTKRNLSILFEDSCLLAVDKPPGLLTDSATWEQRRERESVFQLAREYLSPQGKRPWVAHRIDRDTSGVVLLAKTPAAQEGLREQFRRNMPERVYWAALQGVPYPDSGEWIDFVVWDDRKLITRQTHPQDKSGKEARSFYRVISASPPHFAIVEVMLDTGRRNQIRVHCQLRNHPLVGERLYLPRDWEERGPRLDRQALHARRLTVEHPITGRPVTIESPLPPELAALQPTPLP
jgi:23S rRNA pseudouridine1911/1915/1917 synthase